MARKPKKGAGQQGEPSPSTEEAPNEQPGELELDSTTHTSHPINLVHQENVEVEHTGVTEEKQKIKKTKIKGTLFNELVVTEASDEARELYNQSRFGQALEDGKIQLSLLEALYLIEKGKLEIYDGKKALDKDVFLKKAKKCEPNFWIRYIVFKDIRNRGYIIKTALKFGADFRIYDRGVKPGEDHARWVVYPIHEGEQLTWHEFAAKNRVAHSTKKRLMLGIVDDEGDVSYWECRWIRP
ncbi:MAG TPA: tRNA-intron lyase [Candidatus Nanoarchaeia archaeon]|nr:tRNA-intron lyase [Candidatus Nanoarchaeia archaeon]